MFSGNYFDAFRCNDLKYDISCLNVNVIYKNFNGMIFLICSMNFDFTPSSVDLLWFGLCYVNLDLTSIEVLKYYLDKIKYRFKLQLHLLFDKISYSFNLQTTILITDN